jgi:hypothetical protein
MLDAIDGSLDCRVQSYKNAHKIIEDMFENKNYDK